MYQITEKYRRSLKQHEMKARNLCISIQQERGPEVKTLEFFDDNIKKYEFQLGITAAILDASLVLENQIHQEEQERFNHKRPNQIDEHVDTLDLGAPEVFAPPKVNNIMAPGTTFDQHEQTMKLAPDDTIQLGIAHVRTGGKVGVSNANETANETIGGMVMAMNKEDNQ